MSLLQWVKSGFGLGQRRTSETTPPSLETSDTFGEGPDLSVPREDYGELFAAPEEYRDTAFAAEVEITVASRRGGTLHGSPSRSRV